jgi:hypothetical protein
MSEATLPIDAKAEASIKRKAAANTLTRVLRYTIVRLVVLFLTVVQPFGVPGAAWVLPACR